MGPLNGKYPPLPPAPPRRVTFGPAGHPPVSEPLTIRLDLRPPIAIVPMPNPWPTSLSPQHQHRQRLELIGKYRRYMPQALAIAAMSKGSTKVGALVLGDDFEPLSSGWNGAPRGCAAEEDQRGVERDERLKWTVHAEANAIANAARAGARLKGATMVVTHTPCIACATLTVQAGIKRVITHKPDGKFAERWKGDLDRARRLFIECGVEHIEIDTSGETA